MNSTRCGTLTFKTASTHCREFLLSDAFKTLPVVEDSQEVLRKLKPYYKFVVVTSRELLIQDVTLEWLKKNFDGVFDEILFGNHYGTDGPVRSKPEMCKELHST
eukprot:GABW01000049.1.p1 GENE.GABW01000049.1~~GABW01000049.1.p1  ORF type:complete len:104 (-),score=15.31 GABW01000049.1:3-314(-)